MNCAFKYCQYNIIINPQMQEELRHITLSPCPFCKLIHYCSEKCRIQDWEISHKYTCTNDNQSHNISRDYNDMSSNVGVKRSLEDYEEVVGKNKSSDLGKGSFGNVKLVKEKKTGQLFAMKTMTKKSIFEYSSVENLKREIKIQKKLTHPHIVKLIHYFEDKENVYLILEYAENGSLFRYLRKKTKFTEYEAFVYFFQTCLGIDYLHKKNIIHRDLKPENLLLDKQGNIKLCDFGWSAESLANKRTTFCGTIDYMAPEMIKNSPHDFKLDIWCLGVLLFELTHGFPPFKGKTENEKFKNIVKNTGIDFGDKISSEEKDLISKILRSNPNERLSMDAIFHHPWMSQWEKAYKIKIDKYIWKEDKNNNSNMIGMDVINEKSKEEERKDSYIVLKNVNNTKNIGYSFDSAPTEYIKYHTNEGAADSKKTYSQIIEVEKCLNDLKSEKSDQSNDKFPRSKTQNYEPKEKPFQNVEVKEKPNNSDNTRKFREKDENENKRNKLERAKTKDPYLKKQNYEDSNDKVKRKYKELDKFLGEETENNGRMSKMSYRTKQIEEIYNKKIYDDSKDSSFIDKILVAFGCISRDKKK